MKPGPEVCLFVYLMFHLHDGGQHYCGIKPGRVRGKHTTIRRTTFKDWAWQEAWTLEPSWWETPRSLCWARTLTDWATKSPLSIPWSLANFQSVNWLVWERKHNTSNCKYKVWYGSSATCLNKINARNEFWADFFIAEIDRPFPPKDILWTKFLWDATMRTSKKTNKKKIKKHKKQANIHGFQPCKPKLIFLNHSVPNLVLQVVLFQLMYVSLKVGQWSLKPVPENNIVSNIVK